MISYLILWPFYKLAITIYWILNVLCSGVKIGYNILMWFPKQFFQKDEPKRVGFVMPPAQTKGSPNPKPKLRCGYSIEEIASLITDEGELPKQYELPTYGIIPSNWEPSDNFSPEPIKVNIKNWTKGPIDSSGTRPLVKQNWIERLRVGQIKVEKKD
jgi:hypothetical protein